jgi:PAS domain S-box-containing protein
MTLEKPMVQTKWYSGRDAPAANPVVSVPYSPSRRSSRTPWRAALAYVIVAGIWIFLTDRAIESIVAAHTGVTWIQTAKGWAFVVATAVWLYVLVRREQHLRFRMEETEREAAEMLGAFIGSAPIAIVGLDRAERVVLWNPASERLFGWPAEEVMGREIPFVPAERDEEGRRLRDLSLRGERLEGVELVRQRRDGSNIDVAVWTAPLHGKRGEISGTVVAISDISGMRAAQAEIQRQFERLASLRAIDQAITGSLDLSITLNVVLEQTVDRLGVDAAAVLLLDPHSQILEFAAGRGFQMEDVSRFQIRVGDGVAGTAALERRTMKIASIEETRMHGSRRAWLLEERFVSHYATPLLIKGQVRGVLEVFQRAPLHPDRDWIEFLEILAGQTAIAVENTTLFEELQRSNAQLTIAYDATLEGWSGALDLRDEETEGHARRVTEACVRLARALGISGEDLNHLRRGALLHDIGKMGIPDSILRKPGPLTDEEWKIMRRHPSYAYELLAPITFLHPALDIPYCHHERWDGSGYPRGLKGEEIPIAARIFAIVDVWDALLSDRPYRPRMKPEQVLDYIEAGAGTQFDPDIVRVFLRLERESAIAGGSGRRG